MKQPCVSIIMTVYNSGHYIAEAINSVIKQTYVNWELIIVNDASTDNSKDFICTFEKKDKRIRYVTNAQNKGQTNSLNYGITLAKGQFIAIIDSDDVWKDDSKLQQQVDFLQSNHSYGMVGCWAYTINADGKTLSSLAYPVRDADIRNYFLIESCFIHSSVVIRKSILDKVSVYNFKYQYAQDYDLWLRIGEVSKVYNLPKYMVQYRINPLGISKTKYLKQLSETIDIVKSHKREYKFFFLAIFLWHARMFLHHEVREIISRKFREILFLNKHLINIL